MRAPSLPSLLLVLAGCAAQPAGMTDTGASATTDATTDATSSTSGASTASSSSSTAGTTASEPTTTGPAALTIGGTVTGLQGSGLALSDAGGDPLAIAADGAFVFPGVVADGAAYDVTVTTQPGDPEQTCSVTGGVGVVAGAAVTDIEVRCVTPIRHVVVIGIDGLGGAYLPDIDAPVLEAMMAAGPHTLAMQNALPTMSAPNWMSMIAGAGPDQHGVDSNEWSPGDSQPTPTIFAVLREQVPDAKIGVFHDWDGFGALVEPGVPDHIESPGDELQTASAAIAWMQQESPDLLFVHLDLVDHAGHFHSWGGPDYVAAVASADMLVGQIVQAIDATEMAPYTVVLVTADHGGDGFTHGDDTSLERPIPFIVHHPQLTNVEVDREVRIWDIAATIAALFDLDPPASWLGSPVVEALFDRPAMNEPTEVLDVLEVNEYTWVYDDTGSGAFSDVSIWRPVAPPGYVALGDVAVAGHDPPDFSTIVIAADPEALRSPVGYEQIWTDEGSLGDNDVAIWGPVPPLGYTCLGSVAIADHALPPGNDQIQCVHQRYLVPGDRVLAWTDEGSLAFADAGLWTCIPGPAGGLSARSFITRRHHSDPGYAKCWSVVARGAGP